MEKLHKCYIGYYTEKRDIVLAVSKKKEILLNYLENHRGLLKYQYKIEKTYLSDTDLIVKYENQTISEYNGYFIPSIDQNIIEIYSNSIDRELIATIDQLTHIAALSSKVKHISKGELYQIINTIKILKKFKDSSKIMNKMNKIDQINHSILYCNINEYLTEIRRYNDMIDSHRYYKNTLVE